MRGGIYLLFYTLLDSLPLLVRIFYIYYSDNLVFFIINTFYIRNLRVYLYLRRILALCN